MLFFFISECIPGFYGANCEQECHCADSDCDRALGCLDGTCFSGYTGPQCQGKRNNLPWFQLVYIMTNFIKYTQDISTVK